MLIAKRPHQSNTCWAVPDRSPEDDAAFGNKLLSWRRFYVCEQRHKHANPMLGKTRSRGWCLLGRPTVPTHSSHGLASTGRPGSARQKTTQGFGTNLAENVPPPLWRNSQISLNVTSRVVRSDVRAQATSAFAGYKPIRCNSTMDCAMNGRWARLNTIPTSPSCTQSSSSWPNSCGIGGPLPQDTPSRKAKR